MSVKAGSLHRYIRKHIQEIERQRKVRTEPRYFSAARDAMVQMHVEWQGLIMSVRSKDIQQYASVAALRLAAAAMKFAADLGDAELMEGCFENRKDGQVRKQKLRMSDPPEEL